MGKAKRNPDYNFLGNCPVCNTKFQASCAHSIDNGDDIQTLYVECRKCGTSVVLGVMKNMPGVVTTVGMLTDMTREDISRLAGASPIT